jgi:hypothetical protein
VHEWVVTLLDDCLERVDIALTNGKNKSQGAEGADAEPAPMMRRKCSHEEAVFGESLRHPVGISQCLTITQCQACQCQACSNWCQAPRLMVESKQQGTNMSNAISTN